jgi:glycosyltransferase involved in cell wall biosynthesis
MPRFSIITVNHNNVEGLKKTMQSVFAQSKADYEYIIIDGGSTDGSKEYIEQHVDKLSYWVSEKDAGIYNAMNKGIIKSTGEIVAFLNSGDHYVSDNLLQYLPTKMKLDKADIFVGRFIFDNPVGKVIVVSDNSRATYQWDLKNSNFPHPATFYKKSLFSKIGLFDESYKIVGDFDLNARALIQEKVAFQYINMVTAFFRADGISNNPVKKDLFDQEIKSIAAKYFNPEWLYTFIFNQKKKFYSPLLEKLFAVIYKKKLNKIF